MDPPSLEALSPELSSGLLRQRLEDVLQFAADHVPRLDRASTIWADPTDPQVEAVDKVVVETALLALIASRVARPSDRMLSLLRHLLDALAEQARTDRNKVFLLRHPQTAASLGITQIVLSRLGRPDPELDGLIESAFTAGHVDAVERLPYRRADVRWLKELVQPDSTQSYADLVPDLIISKRAHPIYMTAADAYALTHDLMYVCDFGGRPAPPGVDVERVSAMIDAALAWHLGTGNLDLLAELLLAAALLRCPWSPYARVAWSLLSSTWEEFGLLPSPTFDTKAFGALSGADASAYVFKNVYHTTYVAGILAAILLDRPASHQGSAAPWRSPAARMRPGVLECCERVLARATVFCSGRPGPGAEPDGSPPGQTSASAAAQSGPDPAAGLAARAPAGSLHALLARTKARNAPELAQALDRVSLPDDAKALVLVDTLLINAARDYDLGSLASLLFHASERSLPPSPTVTETVEFLARQGLQSGALGAHFAVEENLSSPAAGDVTAVLALALATTAARLGADSPPRRASRP